MENSPFPSSTSCAGSAGAATIFGSGLGAGFGSSFGLALTQAAGPPEYHCVTASCAASSPACPSPGTAGSWANGVCAGTLDHSCSVGTRKGGTRLGGGHMYI